MIEKKEKIKKVLTQLIDNGKIELGTEASKLLLELMKEIEEMEGLCLE